MSDPLRPVLQETKIIEGEVLGVQETTTSEHNTEPKSAQPGVDSKSRHDFRTNPLRWIWQWLQLRLALTLLVFVLAGAGIWLFSQLVWMQSQMLSVDQDLQTLDQKIRQAQIQAEQALNQLEQQQAALTPIQAQLTQLTQKLGESALPSEALNQLQQKLQAEMDARIAAFAIQNPPQQAPDNDWNAERKAIQSQLNAVQTQLQSVLEPANGSAKMEVSDLQVWALKINTQWLLNLSAEQTQTQLKALQQALIPLGPAEREAINLLLEQDIRQVQQYQAAETQPRPSLDAVRQLILQMPEMPTDFTPAHTEEALPSALSPWQNLLHKLSGLVRIQHREAESFNQVESIMLHQVVQQRLLLTVDHFQFALDNDATHLSERAQQQLLQIAQAQVPSIVPALQQALQPFGDLTLPARKPLLIAQWHASSGQE
ncbi:MAG: hypothetical protein JXR44_08590 [Thiotrichales bacterium]|nr:hypothetical protein [Thiotrichales bacterium]